MPGDIEAPYGGTYRENCSRHGLKAQYVCLSEETDIYGATIFTDGALEIYDPEEGLYDTKAFKRKTVLIDPEAVKKTNVGCKHNTLAHECVQLLK